MGLLFLANTIHDEVARFEHRSVEHGWPKSGISRPQPGTVTLVLDTVGHPENVLHVVF